MAKNKKIAMLVLLAAFLLGIFLYVSDEKAKESLLKHYSIVPGIIIGYYRNGRGDGNFIKYQFSVNELSYVETESFNVKKEIGDFFVGQVFSVIYDKEKIGVNYMLIRPKDFKEYRIQFPDSLNWVKQYFQ